MTPTTDLLHAWQALGDALGCPAPQWSAEGRRLLRSWSRWPRAYHDTHHLHACLGHWQRIQQELPGALRHPEAVALALWFHDAIYWPWRHDNEERSSQWARRFLSRQPLPAALVDTVCQHILATRHHAEPLAGDAQWVVDIDLAILGQDERTFQQFERNVRREYFFVRHKTYVAGRSAVLRSFQQRDRIYGTDWFYGRCEARARDNLARSLQVLAQGQLPG